MPRAIRSLQKKAKLTVRTLKGASVFPETSAQNSTPFGVDNATAGAAGANFLSAPGAGFCWVITSLIVSFNVGPSNTVRVTFTGGLAAQASAPAGATSPAAPP